MAIQKTISAEDWHEMKLANFKAHVIGPVTNANITREEWTSFGTSTNPFVFIEGESYGDWFKLAPDKSSIIIKKPCLFEFGGCVHIINLGAGAKDVELGTRIYKNGNSEARCSQVYYSVTMKADDGEMTLKYSGTDATHKPNEYINLQYYLDDDAATLEFSTADIFDNQVAATIYLKVIGLPQFTNKNEKIKYTIK